jgi:tetratricopeptide (TPR) repeat protein
LTTRYIYLIGVLTMLVFSSIGVQAQKKKKPEGLSVSGELKSREAEFYFTEAEKYFILEDYAKALVYYQKALDILPENATIHYKIAEVLSRGEKQDDMIRASLSIEQALQLERKNKYFYLLGTGIYTNLSRFDKAAQLYEAMLQEVPGTEEYLYELALIYIFANKPAEAIRTYNRAESAFGINETSSVQKQKLYLEAGKFSEAIAESEKLLQAFPDEERYAMALAELLSQQNQRDKAIALLEKFRDENSDAANTAVLLAGLYRDVGQEEKARQLLLHIFEDPEVDISSKLIVLSTYNAELSQSRTKNQPDTAKEAFVFELFSKLEQEHPDDESIHILGGDLYLSTGQHREAENQYLEAIRLGDVNYEVWQNLLYLQTQREAFEEVIKNSESALEYFPNQGMLYYLNGLAHLRKNKYRESVTSLEMGKRLSSSNPALTSEINSLLGDAYHGTREYEKSDKAYDEALAHDPNNYIVLNNYSYYLALRKASLDKAEKMSSLLIKNNPDNATFLDTHAWVLYARQKYKDARKIIERAIATGQGNATHFEHYGDILYRLGEIDLAVKQWEKAKSLLNAGNEMLNKKIANRKIYE